MKIKCGWVEFLDTEGRDVARGALSVDAIPGLHEGPWDGEVRLLRGAASLAADMGVVWTLRFEWGAARRHIQVRSVVPRWAPSGLHAIAHIRSRDHEFPPFVYELGGE